MKTKRLFLKLFLAVCFLMAVPAMRAEAEDPYDINLSDISISGDKITFNNTEKDLSSDNYTINGTAYTPRTIKIENASKNVNLIFDNVDADANLQLIIDSSVVTITMRGANKLIAASGSAVEIKGNGQLYLTSSGSNSSLRILGGNSSGGTIPAVKGGGFIIRSGEVTLVAGNGDTVPFAGTNLTIENGILNCLDGNQNKTNYGEGTLVQKPGAIVNANGLAYVDTKTETIKGLTLSSNNYIFSIFKDGKYDLEAVGEVSDASNIAIKDSWYNETFSIEPRKTASTTPKNTVSQFLKIPTKSNPPTALNKRKDETTSGAGDGIISGVDESMEYSTDNGKTWHDCKLNNGVFSCTAGNYQFRYAAGANFASDPSATITVNRGTAISVTLSKDAFDSVPFHYTDLPTPINVTIKNLDQKSPITIIDVTVNDDFETDGPSGILNGNGEVTWTILPKLNRLAGKYTTEVVVHYKNADNKEDSLSSAKNVTFEVTKLSYPGDATPPAPDTTKVQKVTFESITLEKIPDDETTGATVEYGIYNADETKIEWQKSNEFTKLDAETEYQFVARYAESDNYAASKPSSRSEKPVTTEKKVSIVYSTKELSLIPGRTYEISISGATAAQAYTSNKTNGNIDIKDGTDGWFGKTIVLVDASKGTRQELAIPDIGKAPTSPKGQAESFSSAGDGKILGVTTSMEYKLKGSDDDWVTCPAKTIENLPAGTYLVRTKAVDEGTGENRKYTFASQAKEVVVGRGNALSISPETFDLGKSPYKVLPAAKAIAFRNHDKTEDITIKSIALSDESPFAILHKETDSAIVPAGKNNETFKIQPKPDLNVGTYTDEFVVTFEVGYNPDTSTGDNQIQAQAEGFNTDSPDTSGEKSASIPITFTVEKGTQEAPPVPAEKSVKSTSITLETIPNSTVSGAKAQYSKDGGKTWQDSPTFNKLKADTEYYFVSRYAATDNYNESEISNGENAITTEEKDADKDDDDNSGNKNVSSNANGSTGSNGSNGSGTNGSGTTGTNGNGTTGTNGTGTNGTNSGSGSNSSRLTSARTGDLNNIQLWVALMIGSYLSSYLIIKDRIKKAKVK